MEVAVVAGTLERRDGAQINFHPPGFRLLHHSLYALYNLAGYRLAVAALGSTYVVDAFKDNYLLYAALHQNVSVEAFLGECPETARHGYAVVADAQVQYTLVGYLMFQLQHLRHNIRPPVLGIIRGAFSIGDGVSHDGDGTHVGAHRIHIDAADVVPVVLAESLFEVGVGIGYSLHDIRGGT